MDGHLDHQVECPNCSRQLLPDSMRIHQRKCTQSRPQKVSRKMKRKMKFKRNAIPAADFKPTTAKPKRRTHQKKAQPERRNRGMNNSSRGGRGRGKPRSGRAEREERDNAGDKGGYGRQNESRRKKQQQQQPASRGKTRGQRGGRGRGQKNQRDQRRAPQPPKEEPEAWQDQLERNRANNKR